MSDSSLAASAPRRHGLRWSVLIRCVGLAVFVVFCFLAGDLITQTLATLARLSPFWYALGLLLYVCGLAMSGLRMGLFIRAAGGRLSRTAMILDHFKATGVNAALAIGAGEVYRVGRLRGAGLRLGEASGVLVIDRVFATASIAAVGILGAAVFGVELTGFVLSGPVALMIGLGGALLGYAVGRVAVARWFPALSPLFSNPRALSALCGYSVCVLSLWIASIGAFARALGLEVDFFVVAFAAPLVTLASLLPISIGGVGVREAGYVLLLSPYGVTSNEAVALGVVQYSAFLAVAAGAWALFTFGPRGSKDPSCESDPESEPESGQEPEPNHVR